MDDQQGGNDQQRGEQKPVGKRGSKEWRAPYHDAFVRWHADPTDQRSKTDLAKDLGVDLSTLCHYEREHGDVLFFDVDRVRAQSIPKIRSIALRALVSRINKSDAALKLALTVTRDLVELSESKTEFKTPEEKRKAISELVDRLSKSLEKQV